MKRYIYSKSSDIITHFFLLVLLIILPFMFSDRLLESETTLRFITSGVLVSIISLFFLIVYLSDHGLIKPALAKNHFYKLLFLYLIFLACTILKSFNKGEALYDYLKMCTVACYFLLFLSLLKNRENFLPLLLKYINIAVLIFTLIALSQIGLQLKESNKININYLISSSLGNKNFYAETIALCLPLILMGALRLRRFWRFISITNIIIIIFTIVSLQTLSTWIAIGIGIVFILTVLYMDRKNTTYVVQSRSKSLQLALALLLIIGITIPLVYQVNHFGLIHTRMDKMTSYLRSSGDYAHEDEYHTNSISERIFLWKNAWNVFRDHPLTGAGLDNWQIYSPKYELPYSKYVLNSNICYVRPHNDLLLILAEEGVIGLILFLSFFIYAIILSLRLIRRTMTAEDKIELLLPPTALLMYLTIACVSLPGDRFYTVLLLFVYFAVICARYERQDSAESGGTGLRTIVIFCFIAMLCGISTTYIGYRRYASEIHLLHAMYAQNKKDWQKMSYHAAMAKNFFFPMDFTADPIAWYQGKAAFYAGSPATARFYFEEALRSNPYNLNVLNDLATSIEREGDDAKALRIYDQVLGMAPYFTSAFMNKVVILYNSGDHEKAYQYLRSFPRHKEETYRSIMSTILTNKVIDAISDTAVSRQYLRKKKDLIKMDSISIADHVPFEQLVLRDTALTNLK